MNIVWPVLGSQVLAPIMALDLPDYRAARVVSATDDREKDEVALVVERGRDWEHVVIRDASTTPRFEFRHDSRRSAVYGRGSRGQNSGAIGVMLIGLPGLVLASPLILLAHGLLYPLVRALTGLDQHAAAAYARLAWWLARPHRRALRAALLAQVKIDAEAFRRAQIEHDEEANR